MFWLILCILLFAPSTSTSAGEPAADPAAEIWGKKCASCHGQDAKGNAKMASMLKLEPALLDMTKKETVSKTDADLRKIVEEGKNKMPAFKISKKLTDDEISQAMKHMRKLIGGGTEAKK
jgi:mono/diheme cytochrome c family protein